MGERERDGFFPFAFETGCLTSYDDLTLYTRRLGDYEVFRADELFVPKHLLGHGVLVLSFGIEHEDCAHDHLLSADPVPLDAFEKYGIESFKIGPKQRGFIRLRSITHDITIALALRGFYHGRGHG